MFWRCINYYDITPHTPGLFLTNYPELANPLLEMLVLVS